MTRPRTNPEGSRVVSARLWPVHLDMLARRGGSDSDALRSLLDDLRQPHPPTAPDPVRLDPDSD